MGPPADDKISISVFDTVLSGKQIIGSIVGTRKDLTDVFALHAAGRIKVITERRITRSLVTARLNRTCR